MASLYELTDNYRKIQMMIEEGQEGLEDTLESIEDAIEIKLESIGKVLRNLDGEIQALKAEEKRLADKRKSIENNVKRLKQYAENSMRDVGQKKVKTSLFTFAIQRNPASLKIVDENVVPKKYFVPVDPKLDKNTIKELLKNNESIPGVELVQSESLRIK